MKVEISATSCWTADEIIRQYPWLTNYGFEFDEETRGRPFSRAYIEIDGLEDVFKIMHDSDEELVISRCCYEDTEYKIEIYDNYRE